MLVINTRNKEVAKWSTPHTYRFREKKILQESYLVYNIYTSKYVTHIHIYMLFILKTNNRRKSTKKGNKKLMSNELIAGTRTTELCKKYFR